jgi:hypothetical protein
MQVLVILDVDDHRVETHADEATPRAGLQRRGGDLPPYLPFRQVWASAAVSDERTHEIVNGYVPPPGGSDHYASPVKW